MTDTTHDTRYVTTRIHLQRATEGLSVAYWTGENFHAMNARAALIEALCGKDDPITFNDFVQLIEDAIHDAHDMDVTPRDYALSVARTLLDTAIPLPTDAMPVAEATT
jgi:hypothetical protein